MHVIMCRNVSQINIQTKHLDLSAIMCINSDTHLFSGAGDEALVQPESLFLGETLSLVVPKQGTLDLSHANKHTHTRTH